MATRRRIGAELVRRGLAPDITAAHREIARGRVIVGGAPATNAQRLVHPGEALELLPGAPRYVSRAGAKLAAALDRFGIAVGGRVALDVGASTGGFTDCLLQRGAVRVVALDVGHNQLHERLRKDTRVDSRERTDIRAVGPDDLGGPFNLVTVDVSFVALDRVLDAIGGQAAPGADLVVLVKPQFEASRRDADRGRGVIRDPAVWATAVADVGTALRARGAAIMDGMASPLQGADGNVEFLLHVRGPTSRWAHVRANRTGP